MTGSLDTIAGALLWSRLGGAELIVAVIVGLVLVAFALPARLHGDAGETDDRSRDAHLAGPRHR